MDKTTLVIAFFSAAILAGLFVQYGASASPAPASKEHFMQKSIGAPTSGPGMGPYDSVSLDGGISGWGATEPHSAAPIEGLLPSHANDNKLMFLVGNKVDPSCCPAAFNTDTGCVCLTEENRDFMGSRAGNRA
uniref:Uncharacterized protein n=1 Tax=viral metagenome TaxID=1070528 RepID=A0A6C0EQT4_9ZZZZ